MAQMSQQEPAAHFPLPQTDNPFVAAFAATRMPMLITDPHQPDNPIIFVNAAFLQLTGYDRHEILGSNCRFLQGPGTNADDVAKVRQAIERLESIEIDLLNYRKDGSTFWNRLLVSPVFSKAGELTHFFASQFDVSPERNRLTELAMTQTELEAEIARRMQDIAMTETRLRFVLGAAEMGTWTLDVTNRRLLFSKQCLLNHGRQEHESFGMPQMLEIILPEDRPRWQEALEMAIRDRSELNVEYRVRTPDDDIRWIEIRGNIITDPDDPQITMVGVTQNITERKKAEEHRRLLARELAHRVKNSLATAQAVFSHSLRGASDMEDARSKALGRIQAMSAAQDLLTRDQTTTANLREVVEEALKPFDSFDIRITGPGIALDEKGVSAFTLALYELATNSLKYGALSVDGGAVVIDWKVRSDRPDHFEFRWSEHSGPPVTAPERRGFGSSIIEDITSADLGGTANLSFKPSGVEYHLLAPLRG